MSEEEDERKKKFGLEWRDYVAIVIASFETTLLPIVIFVLVIFLLLLIFH